MNIVHIQNIKLPSYKKEWNAAICITWMDVEISILNEINLVEKDKYYMVSLKCVIQKK